LRRRKKKGKKKRQDEVMQSVRRGAPSNTQTLICLTVTGLQRNMPSGDEKNITENSKEKGTDDE
jgi:hypothetical protein